MTRINVVPVHELAREHLVAEYRELPRVFALAYKAHTSSRPWTNNQPREYTLGTGHVIYFYDKLGFLADRHAQLVQEMLRRGYRPNHVSSLRDLWQGRLPEAYWKSYEPTKEAIRINWERIDKRLRGDKS